MRNFPLCLKIKHHHHQLSLCLSLLHSLTHSVSVSVSVSVSLSLSECLPVCLPIYLSIYLSINIFILFSQVNHCLYFSFPMFLCLQRCLFVSPCDGTILHVNEKMVIISEIAMILSPQGTAGSQKHYAMFQVIPTLHQMIGYENVLLQKAWWRGLTF